MLDLTISNYANILFCSFSYALLYTILDFQAQEVLLLSVYGYSNSLKKSQNYSSKSVISCPAVTHFSQLFKMLVFNAVVDVTVLELVDVITALAVS